MTAERRSAYYTALANVPEHEDWALDVARETAWAGWVRRRGDTTRARDCWAQTVRIRPPFVPPVLDRDGPRLVIRRRRRLWSWSVYSVARVST